MTNLQLDYLATCCSMILTFNHTLKELAVFEEEQLTNETRDYINLHVLRESIRAIDNAVDNIAVQYDMEVKK